ncbi:MAG: class I SAM-dependent methyltransferase [Rhodospirillales bacterium]
MSATRPAKCPVCSGPGKIVRHLPADEIKQGLEAVFAAAPPAQAVPCDFDLAACGDCGLVYADPMQAGGQALYDWLTGFPKYHAQGRWEWARIKDVLRTEARPLRLLELGAGQGDFLATLGDLADVTAEGIDLSERSVAKARARGLAVRKATLEQVIVEAAESYDAVVLSHVLEHVATPGALMGAVKNLLAPGGRILFSLPYSPMSREYLHDDVMNLPPHHMTRWNIRALEGLARVLDLSLETWMPKAKAPWKRALKHTCDKIRGEGRVRGLARLPVVLANWGTFRRVLADHRAREQVGGQMAADTILVSLKKQT